MTLHAIGPHTFALWLSDPPPIIHQRVATHVRPGQDGVTQQRLGKWGVPFDAVVAAHFPSTTLAQAAIAEYAELPGAGPVSVIWDNVPWTQYGQLFLVEAARVPSMQVMPRLIGPTYDYIGGVEVIVNFRLVSIDISELT